MAVTNLTDARIGALVPRKTPYERRDARLRGFGVRVTPSGRKRFFVHCQHRGERVWKTGNYILNLTNPVKLPICRGRQEGSSWHRKHRERATAKASA